MSHTGPIEHIKRARKRHVCEWCGEDIEPGQPYDRYRYYEEGEPPGTVKAHPECMECIDNMDADDLIYQGASPRGSDCGWCMDCEFCRAAKQRQEDERQRKAANAEIARMGLAS